MHGDWEWTKDGPVWKKRDGNRGYHSITITNSHGEVVMEKRIAPDSGSFVVSPGTGLVMGATATTDFNKRAAKLLWDILNADNEQQQINAINRIETLFPQLETWRIYA
jgi:hypothetical protein